MLASSSWFSGKNRFSFWTRALATDAIGSSYHGHEPVNHKLRIPVNHKLRIKAGCGVGYYSRLVWCRA
jgi:hypothetical protein